jgi:hypothetical protein
MCISRKAVNSLYGLLIISGILLAINLAASSATAADKVTITLNAATRYQTMSGWEATSQSGVLADAPTVTNHSNANPAFALYSGPLFDQLVNDLGVSRLRLEVGEGAENTTDYFSQYLNGQIPVADDLAERNPVNDDNNPLSVDAYISAHPTTSNIPGFIFSVVDYEMEKVVLPIKQRVEARGEHLFINVCYVAFTPNAFMQYTNPDEYAEFVLATYQHLKNKYGVTPDAWEVILEPDNTSFNGTLIGQAIAAAAPRLRQFGFTPHFIVPSVTNMNNFFTYYNDIKAVLGNAGISQNISELSYHRYATNDSLLPGMATEAKNRGIGTAMLEHGGSGYQDLHTDLKQGNNSAWQRYIIGDYYNCVPCMDGKYYTIDQTNLNSPIISMTNDTKFLRQYFKFIRPGAVRIDAQTTDANFDPVAVINSPSNAVLPGGWVTVVKAATGGSFDILGLPAGTYGIKYTTYGGYNVDLPDQSIAANQALSTAIPALGVISIYSKKLAPSATATVPTTVTLTPTATASPAIHADVKIPKITETPDTATVQTTVTPIPTAMASPTAHADAIIAKMSETPQSGDDRAKDSTPSIESQPIEPKWPFLIAFGVGLIMAIMGLLILKHHRS